MRIKKGECHRCGNDHEAQSCMNPHFERTLACELLVAISLHATLRNWSVSGEIIPKMQIAK